MKPAPDFLYNLLPAIYRNRDFFAGEPLRALFEVIQNEYETVEANIGELWNNWFVETCGPRFLPYISDLVGVEGITGADAEAIPSLRALVANSTRYVRAKGTAAVLEHAIRDATGWPARVVEYNRLVAATVDFHFIQPPRQTLVDMRGIARLNAIGSPFDPELHSANVRGLRKDQALPGADLNPVTGRYNTPFAGIFVWRLIGYPVTAALPRRIEAGRYTFHPFGVNIPLFRQPEIGNDPDRRTRARNVPEPITRSTLREEQTQDHSSDFSAFRSFAIILVKNGGRRIVRPRQYIVCDLSSWLSVDEQVSVHRAGEDSVFLDPELGRFEFPGSDPDSTVFVSYSYGFSGAIGGGPYSRNETLDHSSGRLCLDEAQSFAQIVAGATVAASPHAVMRIASNRTWTSAAGWDIVLRPETSVVIEAADGATVVLCGDIRVRVQSPDEKIAGVASRAAASLKLSGFWIQGSILVDGPVELCLSDCTVLPADSAANSIVVRDSASKSGSGATDAASVQIERCLIGSLQMPSSASLAATDSIVDARRGSFAIAGGPAATLERATILGASQFEQLLMASQVIFTGAVEVRRRETGCVRFSFVPSGSRTPQRYECLPRADSPQPFPGFTSTRYGDPGYGQVVTGSGEILEALTVAGESLGAFAFTAESRRQRRLEQVLRDYLPVDLEAQIFAVT